MRSHAAKDPIQVTQSSKEVTLSGAIFYKARLFSRMQAFGNRDRVYIKKSH